MAILDKNSRFGTINPISQLSTDEASIKHTNSLGGLSAQPTPSQEDDLEPSNTSLSPPSYQLNYIGTETDSLILLEDTLLSIDESTSFTETPSLFNLGPDSTLQPDSLPLIPDESLYQDLDGVDGGNGYFHGINKPGKGQGKQIDNEDLHKALLKDKELWNQSSEFQGLEGLEGPKFNKGTEKDQDWQNPIFDTMHEKWLQTKLKDDRPMDVGDDQDFDGLTPPPFQGYVGNVDKRTRNQLNQVPGGITPSAHADINNKSINTNVPDGAPIPKDLLFHGIKNPTKYKGLQIKEIDLHEHLLQNPYTYNHGLSQTTIKPSTSDGDRFHYQDLDIDIRGGSPSQYINNLPK